MSMNGHLLEVDDALAARLRADPALIAQLTARHSVFGGSGGLDAGDAPAMIDAAILSSGGVGCLWSLAPRFLRRWLLGRILGRAGEREEERPAGERTREVDAEVERLRRELAEAAEDDGDEDDEELDEAALTDDDRELIRRMRASFSATEAALDPDAPPIAGAGAHLDLAKDWHLLHLTLTGTAEEASPPAGDAILGGDEIGDDLGYGPARILGPDRVAAVAAFLAGLGPKGIVARFDPRAVDEEVYGSDFAGERGYREELEVRAGQICRFYAGASERGGSVLLWIA